MDAKGGITRVNEKCRCKTWKFFDVKYDAKHDSKYDAKYSVELGAI